jgi:hypothetical protein
MMRMMLFRCYKGFESSPNHSSICYHVLLDIHSMYDVTTEGRDCGSLHATLRMALAFVPRLYVQTPDLRSGVKRSPVHHV